MKITYLILVSMILVSCSKMERLSEKELKEKIVVQATVLEYISPHDKTDTYLKKKKFGPFEIGFEETELTLPVELVSLEINSPEERRGEIIYVSKYTSKDESPLALKVGDLIEIKSSLIYFQIIYEAPMPFSMFDTFKKINSNQSVLTTPEAAPPTS